jgi:hypothetical protein
MSARRDSSTTVDYNPPHDEPVIAAAAFVAATAISGAHTPAPSGAFTVDRVLDYPFPDNLVAAPKGATIAWTFNEHGGRNIYVADRPEFQARRLTPYIGDDGRELTSLVHAGRQDDRVRR